MRTIRLWHAQERMLRCGSASGAVTPSAIAMKQALVCVVVLASCAIAQQPALTIYNQRFAVVRERIALDLKPGKNLAQFSGVTSQVEADSVVLRDRAGKAQFSILEQSYRADTVSQGLLLDLNEGKELDFLVYGRDGAESLVRGKVIRSGYQRGAADGSGSPIVEVDGKLRFSLPGQPLFASLADDSILMPTLQWAIHSPEAASFEAELAYVTGGLGWEATYNLVMPEKGDTLDLVGWVTVDNQSGVSFRDASIKLMAGDVNKLQQGQVAYGQDQFYLGLVRKTELPQVTEKAFDEFHLYSLPLATSLRIREQKQVEFVRASGVKAATLYVYDGAATANVHGWSAEMIRSQPEYGTQSNSKVWVMREFVNTKENGLGIPLPKGKTRFYRRDDADGRIEFTGENRIDHTAKDERLRIYTGDAFDIVGERKRIDYQHDDSRKQMEESFEIRVRNRKETEAVEVRVVEHLYRWSNWSITQKSHDYAKQDAQKVEFRLQVPAGGEQVVTYRVRYTW
jgi:hypothetical protein